MQRLHAEMHITLAADQGYIQHTAVTIASILAHNHSGPLTFHILTDGLDAETQDRLQQLAGIQPCTIIVHTMNDDDFGPLPIVH